RANLRKPAAVPTCAAGAARTERSMPRPRPATLGFMRRQMLPLVLALVLPLAAPAQVTLRVAVNGPPASFDPVRMRAPFPYHAQFVTQIFESPLEVRVDEKGLMTVVPALCEVPTMSPDGLAV